MRMAGPVIKTIWTEFDFFSFDWINIVEIINLKN
jgi:hypothetical protein